MSTKTNSLQNIFRNIGQSLIYLKLKTGQILNETGNELNIEQFIVLYEISLNEDCCQADLARITLKDRANISRIMSYLEEAGYIDRLITTKDKRLIKKIQITEKGKKILMANIDSFEKFLLNIFEDVSEEEANKFSESTQRLKNILSAAISFQV